ncbi:MULTISPECIES: hypothetical protein [unclassified Streptomyces]|uniref:hypothetical protein n=1 Tax=unclassified Streptomyces TaxID=2593676 RepID=UPI002E809EA4|nr:hypothetical protein [Streptomyces sp. NBC_00589]WTI36840.1 hypothetical protein OIC96_18405 [Streptomyces sp. NBC_00775]WUB29484.1 hypothetical protein OHA51_31330 [Streptomyces sp. NBC_00589]
MKSPVSLKAIACDVRNRSRTTVPFGKPLHVPAPFDFELDTSGFAARPDGEAQVDAQVDVPEDAQVDVQE